MKRKIAAILVCCLAFGMTACGGTKGGDADNDSKVLFPLYFNIKVYLY